jgi:hypothetical protein
MDSPDWPDTDSLHSAEYTLGGTNSPSTTMNPVLTLDRACDAMIRGMAAAQKDYEDWSTCWLDEAPEYMATVSVARALAKVRGNGFVTLESSAKATIAEAGAKGRGRVSASVRANGRFDVVVHTSHGYPRIVIEVKRHVSRFEQIRRDVDRVVGVVTRNRAASSISFGAIAFLVWLKDDHTFNASERVRKTIENLGESAAEAAGEKVKVVVNHSPVHVEDDRAWSAVAIAIKPRAA